ncbi:MAG: hypothetical protein HGB18_00230 [Candidatus Moranbacteria bacterium]|nr:hypothetical protein [Candidatus Moranbacteria bacterium]
MIRREAFVFGCVWFVMILLLVSGIRGLPGNPGIDELNTASWTGTGPFESSNDRGRFALTYSLLEDHSLSFSIPVAAFAAPDLAVTADGRYVSLFAPGVSFMLIPGYYIGRLFHYSQVGAFVVVSLVAFVNAVLLYLIARRIGVGRIASLIGSFAFLFATPAFTYAVSVSQHHFAVFFIFASIYALLKWDDWKALLLVWFLCAWSVAVDNPNLFLLFPIGLLALVRIVRTRISSDRIRITLKPLRVFTILIMIVPLVFFGWYNSNANGSAFQLAGTLRRALSVSQYQSESEQRELETLVAMHEEGTGDSGTDSPSTVGFFKTRNLYNGFFVHFLSPDRGILYFTPVVLFGIAGLVILSRKRRELANTLIAVVGVNILLYSMWGDPWGGWSFGSRYLVPTYAVLCLAATVAVEQWRKNRIFMLVFLLIFGYSLWINVLGALGTNAIPPQAEVLALEQLTGHEEKYTYQRSWDYLVVNGSKSLVYQTIAKQEITGIQYYLIVGSIGMVAATLLVVGLHFSSRAKDTV